MVLHLYHGMRPEGTPCVCTWCTHAHHMLHTMCACDMVHTWCTCVLTIITASPVPLAMVLLGHRRALRTPGGCHGDGYVVASTRPVSDRHCTALDHTMLPVCWGPCTSRRYQRTVYFTMIKDVLHIMFTLVRKRKDSSF